MPTKRACLSAENDAGVDSVGRLTQPWRSPLTTNINRPSIPPCMLNQLKDKGESSTSEKDQLELVVTV